MVAELVDLKEIVAYMRSVGMTEYADGKYTIKLGPAPVEQIAELPNVTAAMSAELRRLKNSIPREYEGAFEFTEVEK